MALDLILVPAPQNAAVVPGIGYPRALSLINQLPVPLSRLEAAAALIERGRLGVPWLGLRLDPATGTRVCPTWMVRNVRLEDGTLEEEPVVVEVGFLPPGPRGSASQDPPQMSVSEGVELYHWLYNVDRDDGSPNYNRPPLARFLHVAPHLTPFLRRKVRDLPDVRSWLDELLLRGDLDKALHFAYLLVGRGTKRVAERVAAAIQEALAGPLPNIRYQRFYLIRAWERLRIKIASWGDDGTVVKVIHVYTGYGGSHALQVPALPRPLQHFSGGKSLESILLAMLGVAQMDYPGEATLIVTFVDSWAHLDLSTGMSKMLENIVCCHVGSSIAADYDGNNVAPTGDDQHADDLTLYLEKAFDADFTFPSLSNPAVLYPTTLAISSMPRPVTLALAALASADRYQVLTVAGLIPLRVAAREQKRAQRLAIKRAALFVLPKSARQLEEKRRRDQERRLFIGEEVVRYDPSQFFPPSTTACPTAQPASLTAAGYLALAQQVTAPPCHLDAAGAETFRHGISAHLPHLARNNISPAIKTLYTMNIITADFLARGGDFWVSFAVKGDGRKGEEARVYSFFHDGQNITGDLWYMSIVRLEGALPGIELFKLIYNCEEERVELWDPRTGQLARRVMSGLNRSLRRRCAAIGPANGSSFPGRPICSDNLPTRANLPRLFLRSWPGNHPPYRGFRLVFPQQVYPYFPPNYAQREESLL